MSNPFDAFDEPAAAPQGNPFDAFDAPAAPPQPATLGERFMLNADQGMRGGSAGGVRNYLSSPASAGMFDSPLIGGITLRDVMRSTGVGGVLQSVTPPQQPPADYEAARAARLAADQAMPSWTDAPTLPGKIAEGATALGGQLVGGLANPENMVGGLANGARAAGQGILSHLGGLFVRGAAVQAPVAAVANAGVQGLDIAAGDKEAFSPEEMGLAFALGGALGGGINVAPTLARGAIGRVRAWRAAQGATPEQVAAPIRPEEALATWGSDDVRALAEAHGINDPAHPFVARIEERLGMRRAAEADPLAAAVRIENGQNAPAPDASPGATPAAQLSALRPGIEDQVVGEAASGLRFQDPGSVQPEIDARLRSVIPALAQPEPLPPVIALPGENGRVRGEIIEPGAANSPREVTVPVRGTGEPGVQAGAELRTGQGTALVPTEPPLPRPMADDAVVRAQAQNAGGTLPDAARLSRVAQEVDADVAAGRVPRRQRDAELLARMGAQDIPEPVRVPSEGAPAGPPRPAPPETYAQQNRAAIARREASRPSGNDRPPDWIGDGPDAPPPPRPPEPPPSGGQGPLRPGESPRGHLYRMSVAELDDLGAPDARYRELLSTGGKAALARGETWRDRVLRFADMADEQGARPGDPTPADLAGMPRPRTPLADPGGSSKGASQDVSPDSRLAPRRAALDRVTKRRGELKAEYDALVAGKDARRIGTGDQGPAAEKFYKTPASLDRAIGAKGAEVEKLTGRARAFERAIQDVTEGRDPPARLEYPRAEDNRPAVPGVPVEPQAVLARLREFKGLRDDGGDFASLQIPGLVNSRSRYSFEDAANQLASEGYFPELRAEQTGGNAATLNPKDLLREAIRDGQNGQKRYTADDGAAYKEALDTREIALEQVREVAEHLGISHAEARGLSRGQLADFLAEKRSVDEIDAMVRTLDEAHAADHADFEARMNDPDRPVIEHALDTERENSRPLTQQDVENVPGPTTADPETAGRPARNGEAGGQGAERSQGERGAEGRGAEAQGNVDRPASGEDGPRPPRAGDAERRGGQGAGGKDAQPDLIANEKPAIQAQAARDTRGNRGSVPQAGVESFPLFDPEAAKQGKLPEVTAEQVARNINGKLYSGLAIFDPDTWKVVFGPVAKAILKPFAESWREFDQAAGASKQAARDIDARVPRSTGAIEAKADAVAPDVTRWARAGASAVRTALYSDGIAMRAYADGLPAASKAALHEFLDGWHANAGRGGSGKGATYDEGVGRRFTTAINDLQEGLGDILKTPADMDQVVKLVQNPGAIRPGTKIHDAALKLKDWLGEHLKYMRESGVDVGEIKRGYFPRRLDMDAAWKDQAGFVAAAERAYRASGMSAIEARSAAAAWMDNIRHNGADPLSPVGAHGAPGLSADHVSERVLSKHADEHLGKFLQHDPKQVLVAYAHTAARRAELTRVLGPDNAEWKKLAASFKSDGAEGALARVGDFVRTQTGHVEGQAMSPRVQNALGWVRLWGTMGLLSKATITSLTEVFSAGARSGNMLDSWQMVKTMAAYHLGRESGERLRLLAEDVGTMTNHLAGGMAAARWTGGRPTSAKQAFVAEKYFKAIGLEQWTHGMNVGATGVGDRFIRSMARDLGAEGRAGRQAGFALAELGIAREKHQAFANWIKANAGDGMTVDALASAPKEIAEQYRSALYRFTRQVSVQPSAVARPRWANSPLGSLAFHLSAYAYAVHDNVLLRAKRVYQNGDLTLGDKLAMSGKIAASLMLAIPAQLAIGEARSAIFDSKKSAEASKENRVSNAVSRAGVLGAIDPWMQIFAGLRYQKDIATSMAGPTLGRILGAAEVGANTARASLNPFGPSKDRTDTEKRKLAGGLYDVGLAPAVNYAASRLPLPIAAAVIQAMGASRTREAFITGVGAPPPRNNRRRAQ